MQCFVVVQNLFATLGTLLYTDISLNKSGKSCLLKYLTAWSRYLQIAFSKVNKYAKLFILLNSVNRIMQAPD